MTWMPNGSRPGLHDFDRLRVAHFRDEKSVASGDDRMAERHRLGRGGRFVEERRVRDVERGEVGHHGLEIEQRFEAALRDLGLVGRVGGVPTRDFRGCCAG